jgi:vacuolar-type H+-ATPase subunit I/STV1
MSDSEKIIPIPVQEVLDKREEIFKAFVAKNGIQPDEVCLVEEIYEDDTRGRIYFRIYRVARNSDNNLISDLKEKLDKYHQISSDLGARLKAKDEQIRQMACADERLSSVINIPLITDNVRLAKEKDAAICIIKEMRELFIGLEDHADFRETVRAIDDYLSEIDPYSGVFEENKSLTERVDHLEDALKKISQWADAYPVDIFPEPDMKLVREILEFGGVTLDSVSAYVGRHIVDGIGKIANEALGKCNAK